MLIQDEAAPAFGPGKSNAHPDVAPTKEQLLDAARKVIELYADYSSGDMDEDLWHLLEIDAPQLIDVFNARRTHAAETLAPDMSVWPAQQVDHVDPEPLTGVPYGLFADKNGTPRYLNTNVPEKQLDVVGRAEKTCPTSQASALDTYSQHILNIIRISVHLYADHHSGDMDEELLRHLLNIRAFHLFRVFNARHSTSKEFGHLHGKKPIQLDLQPIQPLTTNGYLQTYDNTPCPDIVPSNMQPDLFTNGCTTQSRIIPNHWDETPWDNALLEQNAISSRLEFDSFFGPTNQPLGSSWSH